MVERANNLDTAGDSASTQFTAEQARRAQDALTHRPSISIRLRIAAGFLVTFVLTCCVTIAGMVFIANIDSREQLLERAGTFEFEIQQARRFEKNWFLYRTNLYDALDNAQNAEHLLTTSRDELRGIIGDGAYERMKDNLLQYRETLEKLGALAGPDSMSSASQRLTLESGLRHFGAEIVTEASTVVEQERLRLRTWLRTSMVVAIAVLVVILMLVAVIATFTASQIIRPLGRFEGYALRIAAGDFSLIKPTRKYRDEFANLAIALNHMLLEIKRHEDQLIQSRKLAAIGTLTAGIAHELNNPLNNIGITAEALIEEFDDWSREEKLKMLNTIANQVERAAVTVANLLDFTRRDESSFEAISINDVITKTVDLVSNEVALNNIKLDLDMGTNTPPVIGNSHNLQQVFLNLFLNAIKAMPGGGTLSVRSRVQDGSLTVNVHDTGVGIPAEHLDKIFDPFFTTHEAGKGTGLGLSVSYGIVKKHHGHLTVSSEVGKGATFTVWLPLVGTIPSAGEQ